jgi:C1A family cysteine protease
MTDRQISRYGWRPSLPDARDIPADATGIKVRREVDPRRNMTPIYDQLQLGSCTANAVARCLDYHRIISGLEPLYPARLPIYALERIVEGQLPPLRQDTGAFGRDGFKVARKYGVLPEKLYPYTDRAPKWYDDPRDDLERHADTVWKLEAPYKAVRRSRSQFKAVLSNDQFIAFGFSVYESFESAEVARDGIVPEPEPGAEQLLGGHEAVAIGYLADYPLHALCANSWNTDWGIGGCFLMPWSVLLDPYLSSDFRTIYHPV